MGVISPKDPTACAGPDAAVFFAWAASRRCLNRLSAGASTLRGLGAGEPFEIPAILSIVHPSFRETLNLYSAVIPLKLSSDNTCKKKASF